MWVCIWTTKSGHEGKVNLNTVLQSAPLWSRSWMFSVLCTVRPSLLAKAWSKGVFPLERWEQSSQGFQRWTNDCKDRHFWITLGRGKYTMFISCIDIRAHVQQGQQAGEPLRLLAGEIQGTALVDLSSSIYIISIKAEERTMTGREHRRESCLTLSLFSTSAPWSTRSLTMFGLFLKTAMCRGL